jgi:hypothetical protein
LDELTRSNKVAQLLIESSETEFMQIYVTRKVQLMNTSKLSEQVVDKKKGRIISPLVAGLENVIKFNSWSLERVPEYMWFALILEKYGRKTGLQYCSDIVNYIVKTFPNLLSSKMSSIIRSHDSVQQQIFTKVLSIIDADTLSPLTVIIDREMSATFFKAFYCSDHSVEYRVGKLEKVTKKYYQPQSYEAADIRYIAILHLIFSERLTFGSSDLAVDALKNYPTTSHEAEVMKTYRPCIRSIESVSLPDESIDDFVKIFWERMSNMTECTPMAFNHKKADTKIDFPGFISKTKEALNYINVKQKEESIFDDKFSVVFGSLTYALKTFIEVIEHNLGNTIIGRQSARIIIEIYIMIKYLYLKETDIPDIWAKYKAYGIGKYKLILLKLREGMCNETSHVMEPILNALVNEPLLEEFTEIDLKYFDKQAIREKAISVGEKELYDIAYDYDSSYAHGLWGAVRESSMLFCDNVFHHFHSVTDATNVQNLIDVTDDCYKYLIKIILFVNVKYNLPKWYLEFLEELENE